MTELAYCEIYKPEAHGKFTVDNITYDVPYIYTSILYQYKIEVDDFLNENNTTMSEWENEGPWIDYYGNNLIGYNPYIRNTDAIKLNQLHIVEKIEYDDYVFCILKTCWIKIFQRKWKSYFKNMMHRRRQIKNILKRNQTGKW
jgi:hypothetical protein